MSIFGRILDAAQAGPTRRPLPAPRTAYSAIGNAAGNYRRTNLGLPTRREPATAGAYARRQGVVANEQRAVGQTRQHYADLRAQAQQRRLALVARQADLYDYHLRTMGPDHPWTRASRQQLERSATFLRGKREPASQIALSALRGVGGTIDAGPGGVSGATIDVPGAVDRELSGQGAISQGIGAAANRIAQGLGPLSARGALNFAFSVPTGVTNMIPEGATGEGFAQNALRNAVDLPAEVIPAAYLPLKEVEKGLLALQQSGSPQGHLSKAQHLVTDPFMEMAKDPAKSFYENPVNTYLMATGLLKGSSRAVGGGTRMATRGRVASTHRPPAMVPETAYGFPRSYAPGIVGNAAGRVHERRAVAKAEEIRAQADAHPDAAERLNLRAKANRVDPRVLAGRVMTSGSHISAERAGKQSIARFQAVSQGIRKNHRAVTAGESRQALNIARGGRMRRIGGAAVGTNPSRLAMVSLRAQGIIEASREDAAKYRDELAVQHKQMSEAGDPSLERDMAANERLRGQIGEALDDKHLDWGRVDAAAKRWAPVSRRTTQGLVDRKMMSDLGARRVIVTPAARRRLGLEVAPPEPTAEFRAYRQLSAMRQGAEVKLAQLERRSAQARGRVQGRGVQAERAAVRDPAYRGAVEAHDSARGAFHRARKFGANQDTMERAAKNLVEAKRKLGDLRAGRGARGTRIAMDAHALDEAVAKQREIVKAARKAERAFYVPGKPTAGRPARRLPPGLAVKEGENLRRVSTAEVEQMYRGLGENPEDLGFVTHAGGTEGSAYNQGVGPKIISGPRRLGGSTLRGTHGSAEAEQMVREPVRAQGLADANDAHERFIGTYSVRRPNGKIKSLGPRDAEIEAKRLTDAQGISYVRVKEQLPWARQGQVEEFLRGAENADTAHLAETLDQIPGAAHEALLDGLDARENGYTGKWSVVPEWSVKEMREHAMATSSVPAAWRFLNQLFRRSVLATSPKWATGNILEGIFRTGLIGATPVHAQFANEVARQMAKELRALPGDAAAKRAYARFADEFEVTIGRGGQYAFQEHGRIRHTSESLRRRGSEFEAHMARVSERIPHLWEAYTGAVFHGMGNLEAQFSKAMAGKHLSRELEQHRTVVGRPRLVARQGRLAALIPKRLVVVSEQAVKDAVEGLKDTPAQHRLTEYLNDAYGKYDSYGPEGRKWIAQFTPFVPWVLSAARFVFRVMPRDHPVATALLASLNTSSKEWRYAHGLSYWAPHPAPGFLQGSVPGKGGEHTRVPYFPFAAFSDPVGIWASAFTPQAESAQQALEGRDWKGKALTQDMLPELLQRRDPKAPVDPLQKAGFALATIMGSTLPLGPAAYGMVTQHRTVGEEAKSLLPFQPVAPPHKPGGMSKQPAAFGPGGRAGTRTRRKKGQQAAFGSGSWGG